MIAVWRHGWQRRGEHRGAFCLAYGHWVAFVLDFISIKSSEFGCDQGACGGLIRVCRGQARLYTFLASAGIEYICIIITARFYLITS